jgi:hypothetical protein
MSMPPRVRKFALTAHIASSVGWLGAAAAVQGIAVLGLTSEDPQVVRGAYLAMEPVGRFVLVPFAFASLLTGTIQSLGTSWGLLRHYWVLFKFALAAFATVVLLVYLETFRMLADVAADPAADLAAVRSPSPALHGMLAVALLLVTLVLSVYKPRGLTPYGRRKQLEERDLTRSG